MRLYNNNTSQSYTIPLTANIYRSDVANAGFGNGYHGFHFNIDWSEYPVGTYTVRAFAGVDTPTTEIHDSGMIYYNNATQIYFDEISDTAGWVVLLDAENWALPVYITTSVISRCWITVHLNESRTVEKVSCYSSATKHNSVEIDQPDLNIGITRIDNTELQMNYNNNYLVDLSLIQCSYFLEQEINIGNTATFYNITNLMLPASLYAYQYLEHEYVF